MARPEKLRTISCMGQRRGFKPVGVPAAELAVETLRIDELEAIRLADLEGLYQEAAAERILLVGEGPVVTGPDKPLPCPVHGGGRRRGRGCHCGSGEGRRRKT